MTADYEANKNNLQWFKTCGFIPEKDLLEIEANWDTGNRTAPTQEWIRLAFKNKYFTKEEIRNGTTNGLQDIINGASNGDYVIRWGHRAAYWKRDETNLPAEAFAEMTNASIQNKKTGEMDKIRKIFPESSKIFDEMINKMRSF